MYEDEFDFEETEEFRCLEEKFADLFRYDERASFAINPVKYSQILRAYILLKKAIPEEEARIELSLFQPLKTTGIIELVSDTVYFPKRTEAMTAVRLADGIEVTPLLNGNVRVVLEFEDIASYI